MVNYFDPTAAERAEQDAPPEPRQPCGHPMSAIRCELEGDAEIGTCYCWLCEYEAQQEEEGHD